AGHSATNRVNFSTIATSEPTYSLSGTVGGAVAAGVTVTLNGDNVGSAGTDQGGTYSFSGLRSGRYTVSASLPGHAFSQVRTITIGDQDASEQGFSSTESPADGDISISAVNPLPQARIGENYSQNVLQSVAGGKGSYHYQAGSFATGAPPLGMILNANGTLSGTPKIPGTYAFTLCATDSVGNVTTTCAQTSLNVVRASAGGPPPTPAPAPSPTPTPDAKSNSTAGASWVYYNGVFTWPGDFAFSATANYSDTSGAPLSGPHDIKITITSPYGGWLPYAQNYRFNSTGYNKLTFSLKPTVNNQKWNLYFVKVGDVPVGRSVDPTRYGPAPVAGKWATYTVPLADLGVLGTPIYKFAIHDETGRGHNVWYVDNVGFVK
ncbi:MAG: carboxypeptidase-like regulatory domain-containing protein, partial [Pseudomonadota bacterium]|nr:carboxypeptidase-like regulatory domain-containing protein [Pseudomonadota bacterium]